MATGDHIIVVREMKNAGALARIGGLVLPLALGTWGAGCVNLDKPPAVAECASGQSQPCVDGAKRDAAVAGDAADAMPEPDEDARREDDADAGAPAANDAAAETAAPASPDGQRAESKPVPDAAADAVIADAASPDLQPTGPDAMPSSDVRVADAPVVANDAADVPASPDIGPDSVLVDSSPASTTTVTFKSGRAAGTVMNGYGWVTLGAADTVTSPTCGAAKTPITSSAPCVANTNWDSTTSATALCVTGAVPALSDSPTPAEYSSNWGLEVGINAKEPSAAIGFAFKSIAVVVSGVPASGDVRLNLHRAADRTTYCAPLVPGAQMPLSSFNTQCWNGLGAQFPDADGIGVDQISVQVGPIKGTDIAVDKLCLTRIDLGT